MSQPNQFFNGKKILIYHINSRIPLRRDNDLDGTCITVINGNGLLSKVIAKIKEGEVEILVTIGIELKTVKLIEVAISKSPSYIVLIQHELKGNETRDSFLADLELKVLQEEGGISYRIDRSDNPVLSLNPGEIERANSKLD
jgi:hypothetical protein